MLPEGFRMRDLGPLPLSVVSVHQCVRVCACVCTFACACMFMCAQVCFCMCACVRVFLQINGLMVVNSQLSIPAFIG